MLPVGASSGRFVEKFGDLEIVTQAAVGECRIAALIIPEVRLADVTDRTVLGRWELTAEIGSGDDYPGCQLWAERLWQAGFGGIWYQARHDPRADLHSVALFGKPGVHRNTFVKAGSMPIGAAVITETATVFGIEVVPGSALRQVAPSTSSTRDTYDKGLNRVHLVTWCSPGARRGSSVGDGGQAPGSAAGFGPG